MGRQDLDVAAERCVSGAYWAAGQNCLHVQRIIVDRRVYDPFRRRFLERAAGVVCGPKLSESSDMGCLVSEPAARRIDMLMRSGTDAGGAILLGGAAQVRECRRRFSRACPTSIRYSSTKSMVR